MKKYTKIIVSIIIIICIFLRIFYLNLNYGKTCKYEYEYEFGEECCFNDIIYKIQSVNIYDDIEDAREFFGKSQQEENTYEQKIIVIGVEVTYVGDKDNTTLYVSKDHIQIGSYTNGIWNTLRLQQDRELIKGQTKTVYLITSIVNSKYAISKKSWENPPIGKCELVLSTYPQIIIMKCK